MCADAMALLIRQRLQGIPRCVVIVLKTTLTAVALSLHSMENSIGLMGLRAKFSDWSNPIITTN